MPLTAPTIKNAKPERKAYKLADGGGMFLLVNPNGSKYWRLKYRFGGKEKLLALGVYPDVTLAQARGKRDDAKRLLNNNIDPGELKKSQKNSDAENIENCFENVAREWFTKFSPKWVDSHAHRIIRRLEKDIFPWIGKRDIASLTAPDLLTVLQRIESRGAIETAHRAHQNCGQIFRYAVATGKAVRDPSADLKGAIPPVRKKHHASITEPARIGELLQAIDAYEGSFIARCALKLAPLVFVRPGELRHAEWNEINFDAVEWRIPAEKMKMNEMHIVPLSVQAREILEEIHPLTHKSRYVFPSVRTNKRPMSENTVTAALRRMGYTKEEMTGHGFRSMASTLLNEQGFNRDWIERQLAHAERDNVRAAYNYAEYLPERKRMMQQWADYLDNLRADKKVITGIFNRSGS